ncbi:hypothetical protein LIA77_06416 [Sarocladium implicatum]|nr:hypothetical protein LIA77_06416 [Sarocladium implicatum]
MDDTVHLKPPTTWCAVKVGATVPVDVPELQFRFDVRGSGINLGACRHLRREYLAAADSGPPPSSSWVGTALNACNLRGSWRPHRRISGRTDRITRIASET